MTDILVILAIVVSILAFLVCLIVLCRPNVKLETKHMVIFYGTVIGVLSGLFLKFAGVHVHLSRQAAPFVSVLVVSLLVTYFVWYFPRSRSLVRHWAQRSGFEIIDVRHRWLFKGPFSWDHTKYQPVFRVRVRDRHGKERSGWVRCGGGLTGVFTDEAAVIWDEDKRI